MPNILPWPADTKPAQGNFSQVPVDAWDIASTSFDEASQQNPVASFNRLTEQAGAEADESSPILDARTLQDRYGLGGELKFNGPARESLGQTLHDRKLVELEGKDTLSRGDNSFLSKAAGIAGGMAGYFADPINASAMLVPVGGATTLLGRIAEGAVVNAGLAAALEPLTYEAKQSEQADYTLRDSFEKIAFQGIGGAILGPLSHYSMEAYAAIRNPLVNAAKEAADKVLFKLHPGTPEAALQAAIGDVAMEQPVTSSATVVALDPAIAAVEAKAGRTLTPEERVAALTEPEPKPLDAAPEAPEGEAQPIANTEQEMQTQPTPTDEDVYTWQQQKLAELQQQKYSQLEELFNGDENFKKELLTEQPRPELPVEDQITEAEQRIKDDPLHDAVKENDPEVFKQEDRDIEAVKQSKGIYDQVAECWMLYGGAL